MQQGAGAAAYYGEEVDRLLTALEEATRATPVGGPAGFVPPAGGELDQVEARFHHFIFGRRGSGKTSLLRYLEDRLRRESRVAVWIDQELFMALSYPDVLVSSVLEVVRGVRAAMQLEIESRSIWERFLMRLGIRDEAKQYLLALGRAEENLQTLRHLPNDREVEWTRAIGTGSAVDALGSLRAGPVRGQVGARATEETSVTSTETVVSSKEEYLERSLDEVRQLICAGLTNVDGGFVFLDEFYRVDRQDQPRVLGYMHRLLKDTGLWIKVASVRYWTTPYKGGTPPQGMQPTQDANEVSLDRGLQLFDSTQEFLEEILGRIARRVGVEIQDIMTDGALTRLVVAAGGVPRDYLRLAREAIKHAKNRGPTDKQGSDKVMAEDVNSAAGQTAEPKLADLKADAPTAAAELEGLLEDLGEFCRHNKVAYFMIDRLDQELTRQIDQLQDLRFVHLLFDGETVPNAGSRRHRVLLLDVAYLSFKRARVDFEGWSDRSKRRRPRLVYSRGAGERVVAEDKSAKVRASDAASQDGATESTIAMFDDGDGN